VLVAVGVVRGGARDAVAGQRLGDGIDPVPGEEYDEDPLDHRGGVSSMARACSRLPSAALAGLGCGPTSMSLYPYGMGHGSSRRIDHRRRLAGQPSWCLLTTEDRMIPPPAQRAMSQQAGSTVTEVADSRSVCVSQPAAMAALIEQAASAVTIR
jgi:hypothetical protein